MSPPTMEEITTLADDFGLACHDTGLRGTDAQWRKRAAARAALLQEVESVLRERDLHANGAEGAEREVERQRARAEAAEKERDEAADKWRRACGGRSVRPLLDGADGVLDNVREALGVAPGESVINAALALRSSLSEVRASLTSLAVRVAPLGKASGDRRWAIAEELRALAASPPAATPGTPSPKIAAERAAARIYGLCIERALRTTTGPVTVGDIAAVLVNEFREFASPPAAMRTPETEP